MASGQHLWAFVKEVLAVVVGAVVVASLLRALVGQLFLIPSSSMEDTLHVNDRVVVEKLSGVKRGEVVVFADPGGWLTESAVAERGRVGRALEFVGVLPDTGTGHLIKRAVGLPGDHVVCCDAHGRIRVNDQPLDEADHLSTSPEGVRASPSEIRFDVVVPAGRIFVLGDNRSNSRDSRCHLHDVQEAAAKGENAFVSKGLVVGRAVAVVWPLGGAKRLPTPATYGSVGAPNDPAPAEPVIDAGPEADC